MEHIELICRRKSQLQFGYISFIRILPSFKDIRSFLTRKDIIQLEPKKKLFKYSRINILDLVKKGERAPRRRNHRLFFRRAIILHLKVTFRSFYAIVIKLS